MPVNEPEESLDVHTADVAPPPNDPLKAAVVPPWHIAAGIAPMLTVGFGFTVTGTLDWQPLEVNVNVTLAVPAAIPVTKPEPVTT